MSKNRRGNYLVPCTHCNGSGQVLVQSTKRRRGSGRSKVQRFETNVAAIASNGWAPPSNGFRPRPTEPEFDPIDQSPLSPGQSSSSTLYHQWSTDDVRVSTLISVVSGIVIGVPGTFICIALKTEWIWPVLTWTVPPAIVWGIRLKDFFTDDKAVVSSQQQERPLDPAPIIQEASPVEIIIQEDKMQKRAKLHAPRSNPAGFWQYADALLRETAAPSYEGGKSVHGAKAFGYTPAEFDGPRGDEWRPTAIKAGILKKDPEKSRGYKLTKTGERAMRAIANGRIGEWG